MNSTLKMKRSAALEWVKLGIQRGNYEAAIDILSSLIEQEIKLENLERQDALQNKTANQIPKTS